jgi:hypothetical protein
MNKLFGTSLFFTLWSMGLPLWQSALVPAGALAILAFVRARAARHLD